MRLNQLSFLFQSLALLTCAALVTLLPTLHFMPKNFYHHDNQRLLELAILFFVMVAAIFNRPQLNFQSHGYRVVCYALSTFLILAGISALLAQSIRHAIIEICLFTALSFLSILIARLYINNKAIFIKRLVYIIWASVLLYLFAFYVGYITAFVFKTPVTWPQPFTGFSNIRTFNQYQLWSLGLVGLPLLTLTLKTHLRYALYIALTLWWVLLFHSASRGAPLAWFIGIITVATIYQKLAWPFIRLQLINISSGFFTYFLLFKLGPILNKSAIVTGTVLRESTSDRLDLWHQALMIIKSSPWLGVGPMHYAWSSTISAHPHNSILQMAAEFGIPATMILLATITYASYCWLKKFNLKQIKAKNKINSQLTIILMFTLATNAAYSLIDGVIVMPISQVMMFVVIGIAVGHYVDANNVKNKADTSKTRVRFNFSAIFAGVILILLTWSTLPEISQGLSRHSRGFSTEQTALGPRLWAQIFSPEEAEKAFSQQHKR